MVKTKKEKVREIRSLTNDENREEMKALGVAIAVGKSDNIILNTAFDKVIQNGSVSADDFGTLIKYFKKVKDDFSLGFIFEPQEKYYANWNLNKLYIYVPSKNMIYSKPFTNIF